MLPLPYTTPAYTVTFVTIIVITRVREIIVAQRWRSQSDPTARRADRIHVLSVRHISAISSITAAQRDNGHAACSDPRV